MVMGGAETKYLMLDETTQFRFWQVKISCDCFVTTDIHYKWLKFLHTLEHYL